MINVLKEMWSSSSRVAIVKNKSLKEFVSEWKNRIDESSWSSKNCTSYYQRGSPDGRPWGIWPGTTIEYWWRTKYLKANQFHYA